MVCYPRVPSTLESVLQPCRSVGLMEPFQRPSQRLIAAAGQYLQQSPYADANIRFDVVEVLPAGSGWQVHCIRDAFASE